MTTADTQTKYLDKILALLAKAEASTFPEEAKAYTAKAQQLARDWQIDEAMLASARTANSPQENPDSTTVWMDYSTYMVTHIQLLGVVAEANDCQVVYTPGCYKRTEDGSLVRNAKGGFAKGSNVRIFGFESGRRVTQLVFASLLVQLETEYRSDAVQARQAWETSHPGHKIKWKNGFIQGFAYGVSTRFSEASRAAENAVPGAALALVDRKAQVQRYIDDTAGKVRSTKSSAGGRSGQSEGYRAGRNADVGQTGLATGPTPRPAIG